MVPLSQPRYPTPPMRDDSTKDKTQNQLEQLTRICIFLYKELRILEKEILQLKKKLRKEYHNGYEDKE